MKYIKPALLIDLLLSLVGLGLFCFDAYEGEDSHWNNPNPALHLPDVWGRMRCGWCGRTKRIHRRSHLL